MQKLLLVRGLPGSGKSTFAAEFARIHGYIHVETDMFLYENGEYVFSKQKAKTARRLCAQAVARLLALGEDVVVSNCFITKASLASYYKMAQQAGVEVEEKVMKGTFENIHNVPKAVIESMKQKFED